MIWSIILYLLLLAKLKPSPIILFAKHRPEEKTEANDRSGNCWPWLSTATCNQCISAAEKTQGNSTRSDMIVATAATNRSVYLEEIKAVVTFAQWIPRAKWNHTCLN